MFSRTENAPDVIKLSNPLFLCNNTVRQVCVVQGTRLIHTYPRSCRRYRYLVFPITRTLKSIQPSRLWCPTTDTARNLKPENVTISVPKAMFTATVPLFDYLECSEVGVEQGFYSETKRTR